ncbi:MAG: SpoIID/LytB domain-containing protein [Armatimonadetes bacterium]|nr:SpoIID/LytB domain-containing protein [Armatimonadota bacterium]
MRSWLAVLLLLSLVPARAGPDNPAVRVALVQGVESARVEGAGGLSVKSANGAELLARLPATSVPVRGGTGLEVDGKLYGQAVLLVPRGGSFALNGKSYRGHLKAVLENGRLTLVNILPLETYIQSVLGGEINRSWPAATLRAHAIASRTYAAYMRTVPRGKEYDLVATILDQVYPGVAGESASIRRAVEDTRSQVLVRENVGLLKTFYSSHCGGHTSDSEPVFYKEKVPALEGVPDPYCAGAPNSSWTVEFSADKIRERLTIKGYPVATLQEIGPIPRDESGRIESFRVIDVKGVERKLPGAELRRVLGYSELRSTRAQVEVIESAGRPAKVRFRGQGWGHGVGLCQWGSLAMGEQGFSARQILEHYYPRASIRKLPLGG